MDAACGDYITATASVVRAELPHRRGNAAPSSATLWVVSAFVI